MFFAIFIILYIQCLSLWRQIHGYPGADAKHMLTYARLWQFLSGFLAYEIEKRWNQWSSRFFLIISKFCKKAMWIFKWIQNKVVYSIKICFLKLIIMHDCILKTLILKSWKFVYNLNVYWSSFKSLQSPLILTLIKM